MAIPTIKDTRHGKLMYYSSDDYIGKSLDLYGEYSEKEWQMYDQVVKENMLIVDGGANIGAFTIPFGKKVGGKGAVFAFEPQIEIFNLLVGNIALNDLSRNVKAINGCLGKESGVIPIANIDYNIQGNYGGLNAGLAPAGLKYADGAEVKYYDVPVYTIDSLNLAGLSLLKLDIEGMELEAMMGGINTIRHFLPAIYVENNNDEKSPALIDFLWNEGYNCWWDIAPLKNEDNFFKNTDDIFADHVNINMLCFHDSRHMTINNGAKVEDRNEWNKRFTRYKRGYKD